MKTPELRRKEYGKRYKMEGKIEGKKEGITGTISICRELNLPEDIIMQKIRSTFGLTLEEAELYFK